jgi:biotin-(acetyl-CoA carboxylase) ligase
VRVRDGLGHVEGTAIAIDHDGALLLSVGGVTRRIVAGDLELMEED